MGFIDFTTGQVLTADQMDLVMRQSVMRFADAATRDTALTGVLAEGMIAYLDDTNEVLKYNGTDWVNVNDNDDSIQKSVLAAAGDIIVATAAGTPSALTIGTAGQVLESDGTALSYVTPDSSPDDIITTQGDLIIGDGSGDAVRLPVGAADTVLTSDGTTLSFAAAAGGGGMTLLSSTTPSGTFFTVSSIPGGFKELVIDYYKVTMVNSGAIFWRALGSSSNSYANRFFTDTQVQNRGGVSMLDGTQAGFSSNFENSFTGRIMGYSDTTRFKSYSIIGGTSNQPFNMLGQIQTTSAIDSITFVSSGGFTGGTIDIYGVN